MNQLVTALTGAACVLLLLAAPAIAEELTMEKVEYGGWPNCVKVSNGEIELIATTDVGPRIIRFGYVGGQNIFKEYEDMLGKTGGDEWRIYGGHRLWHAPEAKPRTYWPDNVPVAYEWDGKTLTLSQPQEETTKLQKTMRVTLDPGSNRVEIVHAIVNNGMFSVELAPWALTVMAQGGRAVLPQEPFRAHSDYLLPARPLVLWHYTNMSDPRWTWGEKFIQLRQDPNADNPEKVGLLNKQGWAAYLLKGDVFIKRFPFEEGADYPDYNSNCETFTNEDMLEVESLGALIELQPGADVSHTETWHLFKADVGEDEAAIESTVMPLVEQIK